MPAPRTLLTRAKRDGHPVIDGERVTFVWHGDEPPELYADFNNWGFHVWGEGGHAAQFHAAGPRLWTYTVLLPPDAYIEYGFRRGDDWLPDPLNPRTVWNGVDHHNNYFTMPGHAESGLARARRHTPRGEVTAHVIHNDGLLANGKRDVWLYRPPATDAPYPLLLVYDGKDWLRRGKLATIVDNLIAARRIRPIGMAFVEHGKQARLIEYQTSDTTVGCVLQDVLPLASAHLNLIDVKQSPGAYGVLGISMSGLQALYTGLRAPDVFGKVISQSGAFHLGYPERTPVIFEMVEHFPRAPIDIWMDVGRFEGLLELNRRMHAALTAKGYPVTYREYAAGHNYPAWREDVWRALEQFYGE
ncbi:MAG: esterase family protein [Anaerolineae bacterium]|nr:esterase family protein [Anaerolineae bacterium]